MSFALKTKVLAGRQSCLGKWNSLFNSQRNCGKKETVEKRNCGKKETGPNIFFAINAKRSSRQKCESRLHLSALEAGTACMHVLV
jgi:hypothetical protein